MYFLYRIICLYIFLLYTEVTNAQLLQASRGLMSIIEAQSEKKGSIKPYATILNPTDILALTTDKLRSALDAQTAQLSAIDIAPIIRPAITSEEAVSLLKLATYTAEGLIDLFTTYQSASQLPLNFFSLPQDQLDKIESTNLKTKGYAGVAAMAGEILKVYHSNPTEFLPVVINDETVTINTVVPIGKTVNELVDQATALATQLDRLLLLTTNGKDSALARITQDLASALNDVIENPNDPKLWAVLIKHIELVNKIVTRMQTQWKFDKPGDRIKLQNTALSARSIIMDAIESNTTSVSDFITNVTSLLESLVSLNGTLLSPIIAIESSLVSGVINQTNTILNLIVNNPIVNDLTNITATPIYELSALLSNITGISLFDVKLLNPTSTIADLISYSVSLLDVNNLISLVTGLTTDLPQTLTNVITYEVGNITAVVTDILSLLTTNSISIIISQLTTGITNLLNSTLSVIPNVSNLFSGLTSLLANLTSSASSAINSLTNSLSDVASSVTNSLAGTVSSLTSNTTSLLMAEVSPILPILNPFGPYKEIGNLPNQNSNGATVSTDSVDLVSLLPQTASQVGSDFFNAFNAVSQFVNLGIASSLSDFATSVVSPSSSLVAGLTQILNPNTIPGGVESLLSTVSDAAKTVNDIVPDADSVNRVLQIVNEKASEAVQQNTNTLQAASANLLKVLASASALALSPVQTVTLIEEVIHTSMGTNSGLQQGSRKRKLQQTIKDESATVYSTSSQDFVRQKLPILETESQVYTNLKKKECTLLYDTLKKKVTVSNLAVLQRLKEDIDRVCETETLDALKSQYQQLAAWQKKSVHGTNGQNAHLLENIIAITTQLLATEKASALRRAEIMKSLS